MLVMALILGAIFRGAQLDNQFRVKDIRPTDYSMYNIEIVSNVTVDQSSGRTSTSLANNKDRFSSREIRS
jgi:hypothetical protein